MMVQRASSMLFVGASLLACGMMRAAAQEAASLNPLKRVDKASLRDFRDRPLFDVSRRRPPEPTSPLVAIRTPALAEAPPSMHLLGVIRGIRDMAIVRHAGEQKTTILRSGDYVGKWIATVVPPIGVRLRMGDRTFEYALFTNSNKGAVPVALAPRSVATGPTDVVGMPVIMPNSWGRIPN